MSRKHLVLSWLWGGLAALATIGSAIAFWGHLKEIFSDYTGISLEQFGYSNLLEVALFVLLVLLVAGLLALLQIFATRLASSRSKNANLERRAHQDVRRNYLEYLKREIEGRLKASIHNAVIELTHEERTGAINPWHFVPEDRSGSTLTFDGLEEVYAHFRRRVLLLGHPGSGKSTTLLMLAKVLVKEALEDDNAPIPLLENLSLFQDFRPPRELRNQQAIPQYGEIGESKDLWIRDFWIQDKLASRIGDLPVSGLNAAIVTDWVENFSVAFLLDGLDEVEEGKRVMLADYLNRTLLRRFPDASVIIASRVVEYRTIESDEERRLRLNGAVTLQPLNDRQIDHYLDNAGVEGLNKTLPDDAALKELAQSPLTLSMMALAYHGLDAEELRTDLSILDRRQHLFDRYVDRMMQRDAWRQVQKPWDPRSRKELATPYTRSSLNRYLGWLSLTLSQRTQTRFIASHLADLLRIAPSGGYQERWDALRLGSAITTVFFAVFLGGFVSFSAAHSSIPALMPVGVAVFGALFIFFLIEFIGSLNTKDRDKGVALVMKSSVVAAILGSLVCALVVVSSWVSALSYTFSWLPSSTVLAPIFVIVCITIAFVLEDVGLHLILAPLLGGLIGAICVVLAIEEFDLKLGEAPLSVITNLDLLGIGSILGILLGVIVSVILEDESPEFWTLSVVLGGLLLAALSIGGFGWLADYFGLFKKPLFVALTLGSAVGLLLQSKSFESLSLLFLGAIIGSIFGNHVAILSGAGVGAALGLLGHYSRKKMPSLCLSKCASHLSYASMSFYLDPVITFMIKVQGKIPWSFAEFLRYTENTLLLRRVGREYEFVHMLLRGHFAVREMMPELHNQNVDTKLAAIRKLSFQGDAALEPLCELTRHRDPRVRVAAVHGLGRVPSEGTDIKLIAVWRNDENAQVRSAVIEATRYVSQKALVDLLEKVSSSGLDKSVRVT